VRRLFVVPTPIGNLEDITLRALRVLGEVDTILAEDTRHTRRLLQHFDIRTPLLSYHEHNKRSRIGEVLTQLEAGDVALVSDAGMPSISDPGFELVQAALAADVQVEVLPGPSAVTTAVVTAALPARGFLFLGFLPRSGSARRSLLDEVRGLPYTLVFFEAPHRLRAALGDIEAVLGNRECVVARELTKIHEEVVRGDVASARRRFEAGEPRGEITLIVAGASFAVAHNADDALAEMRRMVDGGADRNAAVTRVMALYGTPRNRAYAMWLNARHGQPYGVPPCGTVDE